MARRSSAMTELTGATPPTVTSVTVIDSKFENFRDYIAVIQVYQCRICGYNSPLKHAIASHMSQVHFPKTCYLCLHCSLVYQDSAQLNHHLTTSHGHLVDSDRASAAMPCVVPMGYTLVRVEESDGQAQKENNALSNSAERPPILRRTSTSTSSKIQRQAAVDSSADENDDSCGTNPTNGEHSGSDSCAYGSSPPPPTAQPSAAVAGNDNSHSTPQEQQQQQLKQQVSGLVTDHGPSASSPETATVKNEKAKVSEVSGRERKPSEQEASPQELLRFATSSVAVQLAAVNAAPKKEGSQPTTGQGRRSPLAMLRRGGDLEEGGGGGGMPARRLKRARTEELYDRHPSRQQQQKQKAAAASVMMEDGPYNSDGSFDYYSLTGWKAYRCELCNSSKRGRRVSFKTAQDLISHQQLIHGATFPQATSQGGLTLPTTPLPPVKILQQRQPPPPMTLVELAPSQPPLMAVPAQALSGGAGGTAQFPPRLLLASSSLPAPSLSLEHHRIEEEAMDDKEREGAESSGTTEVKDEDAAEGLAEQQSAAAATWYSSAGGHKIRKTFVSRRRSNSVGGGGVAAGGPPRQLTQADEEAIKSSYNDDGSFDYFKLTGWKAYKCNLCKKRRFKTASELAQHKVTRHRGVSADNPQDSGSASPLANQ